MGGGQVKVQNNCRKDQVTFQVDENTDFCADEIRPLERGNAYVLTNKDKPDAGVIVNQNGNVLFNDPKYMTGWRRVKTFDQGTLVDVRATLEVVRQQRERARKGEKCGEKQEAFERTAGRTVDFCADSHRVVNHPDDTADVVWYKQQKDGKAPQEMVFRGDDGLVSRNVADDTVDRGQISPRRINDAAADLQKRPRSHPSEKQRTADGKDPRPARVGSPTADDDNDGVSKPTPYSAPDASMVRGPLSDQKRSAIAKAIAQNKLRDGGRWRVGLLADGRVLYVEQLEGSKKAPFVKAMKAALNTAKLGRSAAGCTVEVTFDHKGMPTVTSIGKPSRPFLEANINPQVRREMDGA